MPPGHSRAFFSFYQQLRRFCASRRAPKVSCLCGSPLSTKSTDLQRDIRSDMLVLAHFLSKQHCFTSELRLESETAIRSRLIERI